MITLRLAGAISLAAAFAGCFTYYVTPPQVDAEQRLVPTTPHAARSAAGQPTKIAEHLTVEDYYERAAEAILKRLPEAQASARIDELPIIGGHIPLPKPRPIPR
jgi:hypothetical protein